MKPTVGSVVHYWDLSADPPIAAIITYVHPPLDGPPRGFVDLTLFRPCDLEHEYQEQVAFSEKPRARSWTWREPAE